MIRWAGLVLLGLNIALIADPGKSFLVIVKDGKVIKNALPDTSGRY